MMMFPALHLILFLYIFPRTPTAAAVSAPPAYTATDLILLSCGESTNSNDTSNRSWYGDERSRYVPSNTATVSSAFKASHKSPSLFRVPYQTARIFHSSFTYTFPVLTGSKFIRLYFNPNVYSEYNTSRSLFSITANTFTLLSNFSVFVDFGYSPQTCCMKEFIVSVGRNQRLDLTFSPSPNSFAFVNGIEIVSIPDKLYFKGNDVALKFVDQNREMYMENSTALENLYMLNVGGARVDIPEDSGPTRGMFRHWHADDDYILGSDHGYTPHFENVQIKYTPQTPAYCAPPVVYTSARVPSNYSISLEWEFPVDSGFVYLLRLHFCEFRPQVTEVEVRQQRVFTIIINDFPVETQADVINWAGGAQIPIFRDDMTWVPDDNYRGKKQLKLSLFDGWVDKKYHSALLNGLEIFKLSNSHGSLAAPNPTIAMDATPKEEKKSPGSSVIYAAMGSVIGVLAVVGVLSFLIFQRQHKMKKPSSSTAANSSWSTSTGTDASTAFQIL